MRLPYRGVRLTRSGRRVALEVIRHHRLLELFLAETLEMPWDRVHAEAEVLEHVISEELEGLIAAKLGDPTRDPHGDPIPSAELELREREDSPRLHSLKEGEGGVFVRVSDADPEMLRYLSELGISPGDRMLVRERQPFDGPLLVSFCRRRARAGDRGTAGARDEGGLDTTPHEARPPPATAPLPPQRAGARRRRGRGGRRRGRARPQPSGLAAGERPIEGVAGDARPGVRGGDRLRRPGQLRHERAGRRAFGYMLLWVVLVANVMAMLIQYLSAKLGIVDRPQPARAFRARYPRSLSWGMWVQAEVMAMATDVAEFVGAALGLNLLFGVPLLVAGVMTGFIAFAILELQSRGYRRFELAISALLGIIFLGFLYEALKIGPSARESLGGLARIWATATACIWRWDRRRDGDAARDLPALGAHQRARSRCATRASARGC